MKKIILILILIISFAIVANFTDNYFSETTSVYISKQADNLASNAVKDIITKTVVPKINMQEILTIKYNQNKVESVIVNTKIVNEIMGDASELVDELLNTEYLEKELSELKSELFKLRFSLATNGLDNPMRIREVKKEIARVKTRQTQLKNQEN